MKCRKCGASSSRLHLKNGRIVRASESWPTDDMCQSCFNDHKCEGFADIADHDEDTRINIIGRTVMEQRKTVAFITDSDKGKHERYIQKLVERFPGIVLVETFDGPVENCVTVKMGPPEV